MSADLLAIPLAFIILSALLCWMIIFAKGRWSIKLPVVLVVPAFGLAVWSAIASYQGWPTSEELPARTRLVWAEVREPDPSAEDDGVIYVWAIPLTRTEEPGVFEYRHARGVPRAYVLGYSRQLHVVLHGAKEKLMRGEPVMLERRPPGQQRRGGGSSGHDSEYRAYDLPPAPLPRKNE